MTFADSTFPAFPKKLVSKTWVEEFEKTGAGWLQILSGSMAPLIQKWDRIYVEKVDLSNIKNILIEVCQLMNDYPEIMELDLNPIKVSVDNAFCVDARYRLAAD